MLFTNIKRIKNYIYYKPLLSKCYFSTIPKGSQDVNIPNLRHELEVLLSHKGMEFIAPTVRYLDYLLDKYVTNYKLEEREPDKDTLYEQIYTNKILVNNEWKCISLLQWQKIFQELIQHEYGRPENMKKESLKIFKKEFTLLIDKLSIGDFTRLNKGNKNSIKDKVSYDKASLKLTETLVGLYFAKKDLIVDDKEGKVADWLRIKFLRTMQTMYLRYYNAYNKLKGDYAAVLPYTSMADALGQYLLHILPYIQSGTSEFLINDKLLSLIMQWIQDPHFVITDKILDPKIDLGFLKGLPISKKDIKFLITYITVEVYTKITNNPRYHKKYADTIWILGNIILPRRMLFASYFKRRILRLGTVLISLLETHTLLEGVGLMRKPLTDVEDDLIVKRPSKDKKMSSDLYKVRVVYLSPYLDELLISNENISRPYLIKENLIAPHKKYTFKLDDDVINAYTTYISQINQTVHTNQHTVCTLKHESLSEGHQYFKIDPYGLLCLLYIIHHNNEKPLTIDSYSTSENKVFLSLFNIDSKTIQEFLSKTNAKGREGLKLILDFMNNMETTEEDYSRIKKQFQYDLKEPKKLKKQERVLYIPKAEQYEALRASNKGLKYIPISKRLKENSLPELQETSVEEISEEKEDKELILHKATLYQMLHRIHGMKYSLKGLILDSILYGSFQSFCIPSYLDTRGRRYYRNTNLNIQAYINNKTVVKIYGQSITEKTPVHAINSLSQTISEYAFTTTLTSKQLDAWYKRYNYKKPFKTSLEYIKAMQSLREAQLENLCHSKYNISMLDSLRKNQDNYNAGTITMSMLVRNLTQVASSVVKKPKKMVQACSMINHLFNRTGAYHPYELDATASGIQMTAILLRSKNLASWCSLIKNETTTKDLYESSAIKFTEQIAELREEQKRFPADTESYTIPAHLKWIVPVVNEKKDKTKGIQRDSANKTFIDRVNTLLALPQELLNLTRTRDLWKKSIMTYGYNSTSYGRITYNIKYFKEETYAIHDSRHVRFIARFVEDHFKNVTQPTFIPETGLLRDMSKILAKSLRPDKDGNSPKKGITISNDFVTHIIQPPIMYTSRFATNTAKKQLRGYQLNIQMPEYDDKGNIKLDHKKAELIFGPNLMHSMDAYVVHVLTNIVSDINKVLLRKGLGLYTIKFTSTHDCFGFIEPYFAKSLIELAYLILFNKDYMTSLKSNQEYEAVKKLLSQIKEKLEVISFNDSFVK